MNEELFEVGIIPINFTKKIAVAEKKEFQEDSFLARWLEGKLSEEEKQSFESTENYLKYKELIQATEGLTAPPYAKEKAWEQLKEKRSKIRPLKKKRQWPSYAAAAASILILFVAIWQFWPTPDQVFITQKGGQDQIILPDQSDVVLNAQSRLSFNKKRWNRVRSVFLQGEAFFSVEEGQKFTVQTPNGSIEVLGTEFNVWDRENGSEIICYSGKVKITRSSSVKEITAGIKATWTNNTWQMDTLSTNAVEPSWTKGFVNFDGVNLIRVFKELQHHYDIKVTLSGKLQGVYSGGFPTNDLDEALKNITEPMGLSYQITQNQEVIIRE